MARPNPGAVPRRPHHISSIAHLFLQDNLTGADADPQTAVCDLAVATPGVSAISAFAAAGLALGSSRPVTLSEDSELRWSAKTFLPAEQAQVTSPSGGENFHRNNWTMAPDSCPPVPGPVRWNHLGCLGQAELAHLESLAAVRCLVDRRLAGADGLIWCLLAQDAGRFGPSYLLGRLVELIKPERISVLLFPDAWSDAGRPGWLEDIRHFDFDRQDPFIMKRCEDVAKLVCEEIPLMFHRIEGPDNLKESFSGDGLTDSLWRRVGDRMMSPLPEC